MLTEEERLASVRKGVVVDHQVEPAELEGDFVASLAQEGHVGFRDAYGGDALPSRRLYPREIATRFVSVRHNTHAVGKAVVR